MPVLTNYPSVLIYGAPGSGKTTFAEQEVKRRLEAGHRVIVCDPHAAYGAWAGCEVVGGGMNYAAIDAKLEWFAEEVRRRYKLIESQPNPQFKPLTLVCDEFTNWAARCSAAGEFFQSALSDIRKAKMFGLIVSHTRTMAGLANASGMAKLRDEALLEVELLGQQCPKTGDAVPRFEALIKLPGESLNNRKIFKIAKLDTPQNNVISTLPNTYSTDTDATPGNSGKLAESDPENFGNPYGTGAERLEAFLADVLAETLPPVFSEDFPLSEQSDRVQLAKLVIARNLGKEKTIWLLWGVRPGGRNHAVYSEARAMLDRLIRGSGQGNN
jgi:hypothetical protein